MYLKAEEVLVNTKWKNLKEEEVLDSTEDTVSAAENFRLLSDLEDLFLDHDACIIDEILDKKTIDEIMQQNETMYSDENSPCSGSPYPNVEYCYEGLQQGLQSLSSDSSPSWEAVSGSSPSWELTSGSSSSWDMASSREPSWEEFISDITSLNLPEMPLNSNVSYGFEKKCYLDLDANAASTKAKCDPLDSKNREAVSNIVSGYPLLPRTNVFLAKSPQDTVTAQTTTYGCIKNIDSGSRTGPTFGEQKETRFTKNKVKTAKKEPLQREPIRSKHRKTRKRPNKCYHLWDFLMDLLKGVRSSDRPCVEWTCAQDQEFRITDTKLLASLWGQCKNSKKMTYDKLSRTIRYYCTLDILKKIDGKRLQFKFSNGRMWSKV